MNESRFRAIMLAVHMVKSLGFTISRACEEAAKVEKISAEWLFRTLTEK